MRYYLAPPPMGPVSRALAVGFAALALVGALFFGMIVLAVAVGLGVLAWLGLSLKVWWLRRQWRRRSGGAFDTGVPPGADAKSGRDPAVIEADYEVISRREDSREDS